MSTDLVDALAGVAPGSPLDGIRRSRGEARTHVQAAEEALFDRDGNGVALRDRRLVGAFASAVVDPGGALAAHRASQLGRGDADRVADLVASLPQAGRWRVPDAVRTGLGEGLVAVLEHAHLLLRRPTDASPDALEALASAGWDRAGIVTWSQLVSFVAFQARLVAGLRVLAGEEER